MASGADAGEVDGRLLDVDRGEVKGLGTGTGYIGGALTTGLDVASFSSAAGAVTETNEITVANRSEYRPNRAMLNSW